jgi:nucleoside-diphosphate-sugar epimerase
MFLITGGSGFIGSHFHKFIPNEQIVNLDLNKPFFSFISDYVKGDIRKPEDFDRVFLNFRIDTIIALAAKHHDFGVGHDEYFDTNEDGTRVMCAAATRHGVNTIIFYSSVAVYGLREEISTEDLAPQPDSPYGASKLAGEKVLIEWAAQDQARKVIIIRPTVVYGIHNQANMFNLIKQIDSGFYFHIGTADNIKSIAYVENLVAATMYLNENLSAGVHIFNYADEPQLTSKVIGDTIASSLGKKIRISIPHSLAPYLGIPFDLIIKLTGKNLPVSSSRIKKLATQTYHSATKLFSLGFKPTYTTLDGLVKMVNWYKQIK